MSSLEANKIFGAVLGTVFLAFGGSLVAEGIFHAEAPEKPGFEIVAAEPEAGAGGGEAAAEDPPVASLLQNANVEDGAAEFRKCTACHSGEKDGPNKVGPHLWDVVNRPIAELGDFNYSAGMREFSQGASVRWDYDHLYHFLKAPRNYVSGTAMGFAGIRDPQGRADLIAYLRSLADSPQPLPEAPAEPAAVPADAAAAPGTTTQPGEGGEATQAQAPATNPGGAPASPAPAGGDAPAVPSPAPGAPVAPPAAPVPASPVPAPAAPATPPPAAPAAPPPAGGQQGAAAPAAAPAVQTAAAGDAVAGKAVFRKCMACHAVGPNAANKIGPELNGIFGEAPAAVEGYTFSAALKDYATRQPRWDDASLTAWLTNPKATVPGTKMVFPGLKSPKELADVIAFLKSHDETGTGGP